MIKCVWRKPVVLALASATAVVLFYVLREHWEHAFGLTPYLLLLVCPLTHFLHHGRRKP